MLPVAMLNCFECRSIAKEFVPALCTVLGMWLEGCSADVAIVSDRYI